MALYIYKFGKHTETVTQEQKEAWEKISKQGTFEKVQEIVTPIEYKLDTTAKAKQKNTEA